MKTTYKLGFLLLFSVLLVSIHAGDKNEKVRQKIEEANKKMTQDMLNGNYEASLENYADDAISMPMFSDMNRGKTQIEEHFKKESEMGKVTDVKFETMEVFGEEDLFVEIGTYNITFEMKNMDEPINDVGKYVTVWKMMPDGSLKIQADIWNTDINYMEQQMAGETKDNEMTGGKEDEE